MCIRDRLNTPFTTHIIIEAEDMKQAKDAVLAGADSILLDEFNPKLLKKGIKELRELSINNSDRKIKNDLIIEISGINPRNISNYLIDGVDLISTSSSITKSNWIDFSMRYICLLYTSDAADDLLCVDLGGRRII